LISPLLCVRNPKQRKKVFHTAKEKKTTIIIGYLKKKLNVAQVHCLSRLFVSQHFV
jgi:hypothetical protein